MDIPEYRNRGRRPITLPSGLEGFVRAPSVMDLAAYPRLLRASVEGGGPEGGEAMAEWIHCALRRCFLPARGVMCEKEPGQCLPGELSVHEVEPADAAAILEAVAALGAGAGGGEAAAAGPFPASAGAGRGAGAAGAAGDAAPPGEGLRPAAPPAGAV